MIQSDGSLWFSADMERTMAKISPRSRRRCPCCKRRATHVGLGGGGALMIGCEWLVRRWVKRLEPPGICATIAVVASLHQ